MAELTVEELKRALVAALECGVTAVADERSAWFRDSGCGCCSEKIETEDADTRIWTAVMIDAGRWTA